MYINKTQKLLYVLIIMLQLNNNAIYLIKGQSTIEKNKDEKHAIHNTS